MTGEIIYVNASVSWADISSLVVSIITLIVTVWLTVKATSLSKNLAETDSDMQSKLHKDMVSLQKKHHKDSLHVQANFEKLKIIQNQQQYLLGAYSEALKLQGKEGIEEKISLIEKEIKKSEEKEMKIGKEIQSILDYLE